MSSKKITGFRPGSKSWKKVMAFVYGWGGAIVIIGAMFKIQHWPGASVVLIGGLSIEAIIFILSAFEPLHEDPDWSLVYPELAVDDEHETELGLEAVEEHDQLEEGHGHETIESAPVAKQQAVTVTSGVANELDSMLGEAKIDSELIASLGAGFKNLAEQTNKLTDLTDVSVATNEYVDSVKSAAKTVDGLAESYVKASESLGGLSVSNEDGLSYSEQLKKVSENLASLNTVYEMQLQGSNNTIENNAKLFESMNEMISNLKDSVDDTKRYKENIAELASNLESLNTVYGNMLSAMNFSK